MHIAFVTPESPYGDEPGCGVAAYLRAIIPAIADAGHRVTVIANAKAEKTFNAENGRVPVHHFRLPSWHWYAAKLPLVRSSAPLPLRQLEWSIAFYREAKRVAVKNKIDVIESTEIGSLFLHRIARLVIRLHGSERIFREHSGLPLNASVRWNDALEAVACKRATAITAPSSLHADEIAKRRGWPIDRVRVIQNPISGSVLESAARFCRNGHNERVVLYTGRLAPVKGIETLLDAAKLVRAIDPSITFVLAGPWQMPKPPQSYGLVENQASANGVRWIGSLKHDELVGWYKRAELFVMPSFYESLGISVLEAMAFGLPVVATVAVRDTGAVNHRTALVVESGEPTQLSERILELLSDPEKRASLAQAARNRGLEKFSPSVVAARNVSLYREVLRLSHNR